MTSIIKVNTIQDGGGNAIITSDGSGNVTTQNVAANTPSFLVTISGTQSISNATDTKIQFNSEVYDTDNTFDSSTNYRFTPAVAGKYVLGTGLTMSSMEADEKVQLQRFI